MFNTRSTSLRRFAVAAMAVALWATTLTFAPSALAAPAPDFLLETYATGFNLPTDLEWAPNGLLFVAEQGGMVKVVNGGLVSTFIDLSAEVNSENERGLLSVAVHPGLLTGSPFVYALYTYDPPETVGLTGAAGPDGDGQRVSRLTRFTADSATGFTTVVAGSATTILGAGGDWATAGDPAAPEVDSPENWACGNPTFIDDCVPADAIHHSVGTVAFGADGMLYVSNGDASGFTAGRRALRAFDPDSLAGKVLRIDPETGAGLADNPLWDGDPNSNRSRVWYLGLRNPFRFAESASGEIWVSDVGSGAWEELDTGTPGSDFGWPCYEGGAAGTSAQNVDFAALSECQAYYAANSAVGPSYSYSHVEGSAALIAGEFYTGTEWPVEYQGALVVADYVRSTLTAIQVEADPITETNLATEALAVGATFGPDGHLYLAAIAGGSVQRIRYAPGEVQPASLRTTTVPAVPSMISLDGVDRSQWGLDWVDLAPATMQQCFSDVPGFVTPGCEQVVLESEGTTVSEGSFTRKGSIQVTTRVSGTLGEPVQSLITIDGVPSAQWGLTAQLAPGTVQVCWGPVAGFDPPPCEPVLLLAGQLSSVEGVFIPSPGAPGPGGGTGLLRVATSPAVSSTVIVDGVEVKQFGLEWVPTPSGPYEVCFSDAPGYVTPPCQDVVVAVGATTALTATFVPTGRLQVTTAPPSDVPISVDGIARNQWGLLSDFVEGTYTVCAGFVSGESCETAVVTSGATSLVALSPQPLNLPPLAEAGPDQSVEDADGSGSEDVVLDGSASFDSDGTVVSWEWSEAAVAIADGETPTVSFSVGVHSVELTVTDDDGASATDTVVVTVTEPPTTTDLLYISSATEGDLDGVHFHPEDILLLDESTGVWEMFFDGSDMSIGGNNGGGGIDALDVLGDGSLLLSVMQDADLPDVGQITSSDILRFVPTSTGSNTAGSFELYFDGSDVGLTQQSENVGGIHLLSTGALVLSTSGSTDVPALDTVLGQDLIRFDPISLGASTAGTWSVYLDGSDVGLDTGDERIDGVWVDSNSDTYLTTVGPFSVPGVDGDSSDVLSCTGFTPGPASVCGFDLFWDGSADLEVNALVIARS